MHLHRLTRIRWWAIGLTLALSLTSASSNADKTLTFGVVPQFDARRIQNIWQPILDELEKQSGHQIKLVGSPNIPEFEKQFLAGDFDFAYMNPYHLLKAHEAQGYTPLVRDVGRTLHGIVVVRKDSAIEQVEQLDGKSVAFPAPNALGASLIPRTEFKETYNIDIEPAYVRSHSSVYLNVVTGQTSAGGGVQKTLQKQPENIREMLKIIYRTPEVAPHPVAVHPRVPDSIREQVGEAFLRLGETARGREILTGIPMKRIGDASLADYEPLRQMGLDKYYVR
jgi:phosphonate transport system substrate-binding protein